MCANGYHYPHRRRRSLQGGRRRRVWVPPPPRDPYDCSIASGYDYTNAAGRTCTEFGNSCPAGSVEIDCPRPDSDDDRRRLLLRLRRNLRRVLLGERHSRTSWLHTSTRNDGVCCGYQDTTYYWDDDRRR